MGLKPCCECASEFDAQDHNRLEGLDFEAWMCDGCMMADAEEG